MIVTVARKIASRARELNRPLFAVAASLALCVVGMIVMGAELSRAQPFGQWLVFRYLKLWAWLALFSAGCTSLGHFALVRWFRLRALRPAESAVLGMAVGVVGFVLLLYAAGALGLYRWWLAVLLPCGLLVTTAREGAPLARELVRSFPTVRPNLPSFLALGFGIVSVAFSYLRIVTPDALGYDAGWLHVKIAQDYARWGGIGPFPGDYSHALPHLSSLLYTWGYLLPGLHVAERWLLALHLEFCLLLWTLAQISVAVSRQLGGLAPRGSWAAFFLLPGFFLHAIWATSEHVIGFFAVPIALATVLFWETPAPRAAALVATLLGATVLTKYQAAFLAVPVCAVVAVRWGVALASSRGAPNGAAVRRDLARTLLTFAGVCLAVVFPHFFKNVLYYENPLYPFAQDLLGGNPSVPQGALLFEHGMQPSAFAPRGDVFDKLAHSLRVLVTLPLLPRINGPDGGLSLFVLLAPAVLWLRDRGALVIFHVLGVGALLAWGMLLAHTRFLEAFTALLAAALAAMVIRLWRLGWVARAGLVPLLSLQVLWIAEGPFVDESMPVLDSAIKLVRRGVAGEGPAALDRYRQDYVEMGRSLPPDAKVVFHTEGVSLGLNRDVLMDSIGFQGLIDYRPMRTPRDVYDRYRALGVTHTLHAANGYPSPTHQEDVLFYALLTHYAAPHSTHGRLIASRLPDEPPPLGAPYRVLCHGVADHRDGLYDVGELKRWDGLPAHRRHRPRPSELSNRGKLAGLLSQADAVLCAKECEIKASVQRSGFKRVRNRPGETILYLKQASGATEPEETP